MTFELHKWIRFSIAIGVIAFVWCVILPLIAEQSVVSEHIAHQKRLGIDPSALFYTELEVTPAIVTHIERLNETHADLFWRRSGPSDSNGTNEHSGN